MSYSPLVTLVDKYIEALKVKEAKERSLRDTFHELHELHSQIIEKSKEIVLKKCEKELESLDDKDKGKLLGWIVRPMQTVMSRVQNPD